MTLLRNLSLVQSALSKIDLHVDFRAQGQWLCPVEAVLRRILLLSRETALAIMLIIFDFSLVWSSHDWIDLGVANLLWVCDDSWGGSLWKRLKWLKSGLENLSRTDPRPKANHIWNLVHSPVHFVITPSPSHSPWSRYPCQGGAFGSAKKPREMFFTQNYESPQVFGGLETFTEFSTINYFAVLVKIRYQNKFNSVTKPLQRFRYLQHQDHLTGGMDEINCKRLQIYQHSIQAEISSSESLERENLVPYLSCLQRNDFISVNA